MRRIYKQLIIVATVVIFLSSIAGGIWWLGRTKPTCFDRIQNGEEEGVDCGSVCGVSCKPTVTKELPLQVSQVQIVEGGGKCDIVITVNNPNVSYGAQHVPYEIKWGSVQKKGDFYIYPNEERYIAEINLACQAGIAP